MKKPNSWPDELPPGTKTLRTIIPADPFVNSGKAVYLKRPVANDARLEPGTLIAEVYVPMRPVPWKAPTTTRTGHAFKAPKLLAWQAMVAKCARDAMHGAAPYPHGVRLVITFYLNKRAGSLPDLSNLVKSTEDALQSVVFVNDRQVLGITSAREIVEANAVYISVYAAEGTS